VTTKIIKWKKYLLLYVSLLNKYYNPCINESEFLDLIHRYNYISILNIKKLLLKEKNTNKIIEYKVSYISNQKRNYKLLFENHFHKEIIEKDNHFYLESFIVNENYKNLKTEIDRLIQNRDKYKTIHFHLNNNVGGDLVPAHIIIRCLVGKKESWMKNIKKIFFLKENI